MDDDRLIVENLEEPEEDTAADAAAAPLDPDEFFAINAFRIVYQTNNFFLPQIRDLIDKGEVLNLRPEYQRRLRWNSVQKSKLAHIHHVVDARRATEHLAARHRDAATVEP